MQDWRLAFLLCTDGCVARISQNCATNKRAAELDIIAESGLAVSKSLLLFPFHTHILSGCWTFLMFKGIYRCLFHQLNRLSDAVCTFLVAPGRVNAASAKTRFHCVDVLIDARLFVSPNRILYNPDTILISC